MAQLGGVEEERRRLRALLARFDRSSVASYAKLQGRLEAEQRSLSFLRAQEAEAEAEMVETLLGFVNRGTPARTSDGAAAIVADDPPPAIAAAMRKAAAAAAGVVGGGRR